MSHHKAPQSARVEARPTLIREVDGGDVRRKEGKQGTSVFWGANPLKSGRAAHSRGGEIYVKVPIPRGSEGAHVGGNDDTAGHCVRGTYCGQVLCKLWTGA